MMGQCNTQEIWRLVDVNYVSLLCFGGHWGRDFIDFGPYDMRNLYYLPCCHIVDQSCEIVGNLQLRRICIDDIFIESHVDSYCLS